MNHHAGFIAVHAGAGKHSMKSESQYLELCSAACNKGVKLLKNGKNALETACEVTKVLEDSPLTNAGYGANLNEDGDVECDAGIMISHCDSSLPAFAAIGSIHNIKNPIEVALEMIKYQREPQVLGRVPPCLLVGEGASKFAQKRGLSVVPAETLKSPKACSSYLKYKSRMEEKLNEQPPAKRMCSEEERNDTVGVICIDQTGNIASTSSSGGIALKLPGRVGQAAMYGCGCWAERKGSKGIAVSTSGCGEQLVYKTLSKRVSESILRAGDSAQGLNEALEEFTQGFSEPLGGAIVACYEENFLDFNVAFTTDSMAIGYMSTNQKRPITRMARNSNKNKVALEGFVLKL